jgi:tripartite motif-containing protein 9/67
MHQESEKALSTLDSLVLTPYGYGIDTRITAPQALVKLEWGAKAYLSPAALCKEVTINVKLFFGERQLQKHTMSLTQTFESLLRQLVKDLALPASFSLKLIYPMGRIRTVKASDTPYSMNMQAGANVVAVVQQTFVWDDNTKGGNIEVLNAGRTVVKRNEEDYESVLTNVELNSGKHTWEITIDRYIRHEDIFIGVAQKTMPLYTRPPETGMFWGYLCTG